MSPDVRHLLAAAADTVPDGRVDHVGLSAPGETARMATIAALTAAVAARVKARPSAALLAHGVRAVALVLVLGLVACDPCDSAARIHQARCVEGDAESCKWLDTHYSAAGICH